MGKYIGTFTIYDEHNDQVVRSITGIEIEGDQLMEGEIENIEDFVSIAVSSYEGEYDDF